MSKDVLIIGAGPAGLFTALTLAEANDPEINVKLAYNGNLPWERDTAVWEGFMGAALGSDLVLAGEPDMAGDLCSYLPYQEAADLFDRTVEILKTKTPTPELIETATDPYKHYTIPAEIYKQIASQLWVDLKNAKVELINQPASGFYATTRIQVQLLEEVLECDYCVLAAGRSSYAMIHSQAENLQVPKKELQINQNKFNFLKQYIPDEYQSWGYGINLQVHPTMELINIPNIYLVGDVLGNNCITTAMVQGTLAAQSILNNIK